MLTALAVVHWNEKRIPEQRSDLYDSIIHWLALSRQRDGRESADKCRNLLQDLALYMQDDASGRQVQIPRRQAAEAIAASFREGLEHERIAQAEQFLRQEELDSGIIVGRGDHVRFWHLTFQEFLAARALAARSDQFQVDRLFSQPKLYRAEWRETVRLLAGILYHNGIQKVDRMFEEILNSVVEDKGKNAVTLSDAARCAGLLGGIVQELSPVGYKPQDSRYEDLFDQVMGVFDADKSQLIGIKTRIAAADALGQAGDPRFLQSVRESNWVTIPAGPFLMKSTGNQVELTEFRVGRYPVTVGEYAEFIADGGYHDERWWSAGGLGIHIEPGRWDYQQQYPTRPVSSVSWYEASAYAEWHGSQLPEKIACRLLTEAEWERAAGGVEGREYPWGEGEPNESRLNSDELVRDVTPVGLFPQGATPDGIEEMAGNAWEWCVDWYRMHPLGGMNPSSTKKGEYRVVRGGSWYYRSEQCGVQGRGRLAPEYRGVDGGFRVVLVQSHTRQ